MGIGSLASNRLKWLQRAVPLLTVVLILRVTASIIGGFVDYLPPDFDSDFLRGRQAYFWDGYHLAFYVHIFSGPVALFVGIALMSKQLRVRFTRWHRFLGRFQVVCILLLVVPSGLWMSAYSQAGNIAAIGFATLAVATGVCTYQGWRSAVCGKYSAHQVWMTRTFLLLFSAVVLRLLGGIFTIAGVEAPWTYQFAAWFSWIAPLAAYESFQRLGKILAPVD
jgi:hypothetical protein